MLLFIAIYKMDIVVSNSEEDEKKITTSSMVGFTTRCPSILPTRIIPMGPPHGISDNISAAEVALAAITSGSCFPSEESTLAITYKQRE